MPTKQLVPKTYWLITYRAGDREYFENCPVDSHPADWLAEQLEYNIAEENAGRRRPGSRTPVIVHAMQITADQYKKLREHWV